MIDFHAQAVVGSNLMVGVTGDFDMEEMKALWLTCGKDVLGVINDRFKYSFAGTYKSRWSDFVLDITMWTEVESIVVEAYYSKSWKSLLDIKLDPAA